ncbi:glycosyltransferase family 4 protein [Ruegeria marina]|uniref:Glycosyltransferase involved in cell wall bisynthesis n=1 Tax=Ruegeria marina TaxID=639004 RepID=A0A1G6ICZ9_9RHOB|nr:glycosyltransferase family 4 protein [Ruegeria marina]SDC04280.1 Glycosyltransferase involved in cell wall bisynthesis [Ruegeria marina]
MTGAGPGRVVILSDFATVRGGASKLAVMQAGQLTRQGVPVTFFTGDSEADLPAGVDLVSLGGRRLLDQGKLEAAIAGLWNRKAEVLLRDWIASNDTPATIYHVHGYHQTLSPSVLAPLKRVRNRTVMHAHDYFLACPNGAFFDFRAARTCNRQALSWPCIARNCDKRNYGHKLWRVARQTLQNRARSRLLPEVGTILLHDGMQRRLFPQGGGGQVFSIANPADPMLANPVAAERNRALVFVGDIHEYKGVFVLAEAGRRAGLSVVFAGAGQDLSRLREEYPEHHYAGWQDREGLCRILAEARLLVAPTLGPEPFGLAPVEALLSGVPVIISDEMLLGREIETRDMGRVFRAGDSEALAKLLAELAGDDARVALMSRNAVARGRELSLSSEAWCAALTEIYERLLEDAGRDARA